MQIVIVGLSFVINAASAAKSMVIFQFIYEIAALRVKVDATQVAECTKEVKELNWKKRVLLVSYAFIIGAILSLKAVFLMNKSKALMMLDVWMRLCTILIYTYMFVQFVYLISFFRRKKEAKLMR